MADELKLQIVLDDGSVKEGFLKIEKQGSDSAKRIESSFDSFSQSFSSKIKALGAALAAAFTVNKIIDFFKESSKEAQAAERATNALAASLSQIGKFSADALSGFQSYAQNLQKITGVSDDLIVQNAALLVSIGNLSGKGLERATKASLDLSQALQIDVGTAFDLVAKAAAGNTGALSRYGIKISQFIPANQRFAETLKTIEERFGGLAQTRLNTLEGSLQNLSNAFNDLQETIGGFITNSPALRAVINTIAEELFMFIEKIGEFAKNGTDVFGNLIINIIKVASAVNEYLIKPFEVFFNIIKTGVLGVKLFIDVLALALTGFVKTFAELVVLPIKNLFIGIGSVISNFNSDLGSKLQADARRIAGDALQPFESEFLNTKLILEDTFKELSEQSEKTFKTDFSNNIDAFLNKLKTAAENAPKITANLKNGVVTQFTEMQLKIQQLAEQIQQALNQGLANATAKTLERVGAALNEGGKAFNDFGKVVLGLLGDLAIQIGTLMISIAFSVEALRASLATLNPASLFVAGAALIVIGGLLKSLAGVGSSGPSAAQPSGGGVSSEPSTVSELNPISQTEPNTQVSVVIQGDVLDSDESGSRIVDLINNAFDKKGVVINQGVLA